MDVFAHAAAQLAVVVFGLATPPALPQAEPTLKCDHVRLISASGVIGMEHRYTISAHCQRHVSKTEGNKTTNVVWLDFDVMASARWERKSGKATETLKFTGSAAGTRFASGTCNQDPWLRDPPGGPAVCQNVSVQAEVSGGSISQDLIEPKVLLFGRSIALAEARALSEASATGPPAPPPPPTPNVPKVSANDQPAGIEAAHAPSVAGTPGRARDVVLEGEDLVTARKARVSRGKIVVQPMAGFGQGWSRNAQLLWVEGTAGAVLDLTIEIASAGKYAVDLYLTRAPDYATAEGEVAGEAAAGGFVGFSPHVAPPGPYTLGTFVLAPGPRKVSLKITGRAPQSTGYLVGIDRVVLRRVE
jgi:hypothetical protein